MDKSEYKVGRVHPNFVSVIKRGGRRIYVHRPVLPNNYKCAEGWQFSYEGVPISTFKVVPDRRAKAIEMFDRMMRALGGGFETKFKEVYEKNAKLFKVS
jgi:hypothetical protein